MDDLEIKAVTKSRGRPRKDVQLDSAARQRLTRGKAHSAFLMESDLIKSRQLIKDMSTSNLISLLPKLMAGKWKIAVETVCAELVNRVNTK